MQFHQTVVQREETGASPVQLIRMEFSVWKTQSQDRTEEAEEERMSRPCTVVWDCNEAKDKSKQAASGLEPEPQCKMKMCLGEFCVGWEKKIQDGS